MAVWCGAVQMNAWAWCSFRCESREHSMFVQSNFKFEITWVIITLSREKKFAFSLRSSTYSHYHFHSLLLTVSVSFWLLKNFTFDINTIFPCLVFLDFFPHTLAANSCCRMIPNIFASFHWQQNFWHCTKKTEKVQASRIIGAKLEITYTAQTSEREAKKRHLSYQYAVSVRGNIILQRNSMQYQIKYSYSCVWDFGIGHHLWATDASVIGNHRMNLCVEKHAVSIPIWLVPATRWYAATVCTQTLFA